MNPAGKRILIVEDEPKIATLLEDYLQAQGGFSTQIVSRGDQALDRFLRERPDLVLLDLMLPGLDGIEVVHPAHDAMLQRYYRGQAARFGLLMSGGSDFHGRARDEARLGQRWFEPDASLLSALRTH